jgi:alpha-tubulin suppressor-like RCC1 family protein
MSIHIYRRNGDLIVHGENKSGQLGIGHFNNINYPIICLNDTNIRNIRKLSYGYSIYLYRENGDLLVCGSNICSQLGIAKGIGFKDNIPINIFKLSCNIPNIKDIMYDGYSIYIWTDKDILVIGNNYYGQLGVGNNTEIFKFTTCLYDSITFGSKVKNIICGSCSLYVYTDSGDLLVCGYNFYGQLALGHNINLNKLEFCLNDSNIIDIVCGYNSLFIYKRDGSLLVCGQNEMSVLGLPHTDNINTLTFCMKDISIKKIIPGLNFTLILKSNGDLLCCGNGEYGQLGLGDRDIITTFEVCLSNTAINDIFCSNGSVYVYTEDGDFIVWGSNNHGQLGLGHNINISNPTIAFRDKSIRSIICQNGMCFIYKDNGDIYNWGYNINGTLGLGHNTNVWEPTLYGNIKDIISINGIEIIKWSIHNYKYMSPLNKKKIYIFLLSILYKTPKIPKFVRFEIFKLL